MKLVFGPYRCGSWRLHVCMIVVSNDAKNLSCSCEGFRLEESLIKLMFGIVDMTQLIE